MRVTCENCSTKFNLDESLVKNTGSKVRCSKCKHIFTVFPPSSEEEPVEELALDVEEQDQAVSDEPEASDEKDLETDAVEEMAASDSLLADETVAEAAAAAEDLDLSDIEKMLEIEEPSEVPAVEDEEDLSGETSEDGNFQESLDLSDFEKILEDADDSDELMEEKSEEDQDLVFDLDEDVDLQTTEEQLSPTTELDLGDLEKMFEPEEESEPSLDLEPEPEDTGLVLPEVEDEAPTGEMPGAETELLGFDVESEVEEESPEEDVPTLDIDFEEAPAEASESLNLEIESEIEEAAEEMSIGAEDLGLEIEPDMEVEAPAEEDSAAEAEDLGLVLESDMDIEGSAEDIGLEIEPDLDDEAPLAVESEESVDAALTEKLGMAFEAPEVEAEAPEQAEEDADEDELMDFGAEEGIDFPDDAVPDIPDEDEAFFEDEVEETPEEEEDLYEEVEVAAKPKGGLKKFLLWFLAVLLVLVIALAALVVLQNQGIVQLPYLDKLPIPFLSSQNASQTTDSGNLKIITSDVDSRFLENDKAGRMFVVTGKVKNEYNEPRSHIQVSGSLYTRGKTLADTSTAYCGNIIADLELSQMTPAAVRTRLGTPAGDNNTNVNVKPGEERPFMIVFFNLPESLDEFTVAVRSSTAGGK